ncbi:MAG: anthranilate synthase component family protein [Flavipsychrobacter sp.]|nr:anthranilate synthase component family protein [Flavipsychrobacter sp.]
MQRIKASYSIDAEQRKDIKQRILHWANQYSILLFLDNNNYPTAYDGYECLLAAGAVPSEKYAETLGELQPLHDSTKDWLFGHICYDYKNALEPKLNSSHAAKIGFPDMCFFRPEVVIYLNREQTTLSIEAFEQPDGIYDAIKAADIQQAAPIPKLNFTSVTGKETYLNTIARLRQHIADGDCYEINFCNENFCINADIDPLSIFNKLNALSPAPFAAYYRSGDIYMMCASPERYIKKIGTKVLSQPIKGTAARDRDLQKDEQSKEALKTSIKERAENVMIVDLVRNDLARCSETGSINVDELFGIYSFPQVHQMISTVSGTLKAPFADAIRCSFPMGSMTGAPKFKVMELIDKYEHSRRELFSGTVGYITPDGDFDLNVIIRSLFYNAASRYLSYQTGGAITYDSNAEQEWEEMRLKAWALEQIFA